MRDSYRVGVWKDIGKVWDYFNMKISFAVGNRSRMKFWKDRWCNDEPLMWDFLVLVCPF